MESKFINKETEGYLLSQVGQTATQRLNDVEVNVKNILEYLKEAETYIKDFEAYQEINLQRLDEKITQNKSWLDEKLTNTQIVISASKISQSDDRNVIFAELKKLDNKIKLALYSAYIAAGLALGMGVALWLIK